MFPGYPTDKHFIENGNYYMECTDIVNRSPRRDSLERSSRLKEHEGTTAAKNTSYTYSHIAKGRDGHFLSTHISILQTYKLF
jgi:hypothetical protein